MELQTGLLVVTHAAAAFGGWYLAHHQAQAKADVVAELNKFRSELTLAHMLSILHLGKLATNPVAPTPVATAIMPTADPNPKA